MSIGSVILNEREAREARASIAEYENILSSERSLASIVAGLPTQVVEGYCRAISIEKRELLELLNAYERAKTGDLNALKSRAGNDPGLALIVARISKGLTQKDLARKLGLKEQQIQRYESDRYRTISLANFQRVARTLGVSWDLKIIPWSAGGWNIASEISPAETKKILRHAREQGWFENDDPDDSKGEDAEYLRQYIADHVIKYGTPSLLRTGLNVERHDEDFALLAWKARVTRRAEAIIAQKNLQYTPADISWLIDLVRLSQKEDGPAQARDFLLEKGIVLIAEKQLTGLKVDGAAFLIDGVPVIGLTLRRDTIDNFWFTLLHEIAHVVLHYRTGLAAGFFDDTDSFSLDEIEQEANDFAANMLIPDEKWKRSPARIAKSPAVIEKFAQNAQIHPAIVFGKIQKERNDYSVFAGKIGRGKVRKYLMKG